MLFIDYSPAFNSIIPDTLVSKLSDLDFLLSTCAWIKDFLTKLPQIVTLVPRLPSTLTPSGSPQGCVLQSIALYTYDCPPTHNTDLSLDLSQEEMSRPTECDAQQTTCHRTPRKQKELIDDFRKHRADAAPLYIDGDGVERVPTFKFLGTHMSGDLSGPANTTAVVKKTQQRLHFLRVLRKNTGL